MHQPNEYTPLISIVVPVYNEEDNITNCFEQLNQATSALNNVQFEFIFTDNHSEDKSFEQLKQLASNDSRVKAFSFSRNFGYQASIYTGLTLATGDAAIVFDCDLQDPPELISVFIQRWLEGYKIVYGVRRTRQENPLLQKCRKLFYRLINALSDNHLPADAGDFRLMDREILDHLASIKDQNPYLRGIIASLGYSQIGIPYDRRQRTAGESKFGLKRLFQFAINGIISQSTMPLKLSTYIGMAVAAIMCLMICGYIGANLFFGKQWPAGFTTTTVLILFSVSLNALFLGIIGEYLSRIYAQVRGYPITIIEKSTCAAKAHETPTPKIIEKNNTVTAD